MTIASNDILQIDTASVYISLKLPPGRVGRSDLWGEIYIILLSPHLIGGLSTAVTRLHGAALANQVHQRSFQVSVFDCGYRYPPCFRVWGVILMILAHLFFVYYFYRTIYEVRGPYVDSGQLPVLGMYLPTYNSCLVY